MKTCIAFVHTGRGSNRHAIAGYAIRAPGRDKNCHYSNLWVKPKHAIRSGVETIKTDKNKRLAALASIILQTSLAAAGTQTTLVQWTFPESGADVLPDDAIPVNSSRTLSAGGTSEISDVGGHTTQAARTAGWDDGAVEKYWQIEFSSAGYTNILLSSKQYSSKTGPRDFEVQYRVGEEPWTGVAGGAVEVLDNWTTGRVENLSLPIEADDENLVGIRWLLTSDTSVNGDTIGPQGASRIDDIVISGFAMALAAPKARTASSIGATEFTARWTAVDRASGYQLDVATNTLFSTGDSQPPAALVRWDFADQDQVADGGIAANTNRVMRRECDSINYNYPQGIEGTGSHVLSSAGWNDGDGEKYWITEISTTGYHDLSVSSVQRSSNTGPRDFILQYRPGEDGDWTDVPEADITVGDNFTSGILDAHPLPASCDDRQQLFLRWIMSSNHAVKEGEVGTQGTSRIGGVLIEGSGETPPASLVPGFQSLPVSGTSRSVTGLEESRTYYYRVRAVDGMRLSPYSDPTQVITGEPPETATLIIVR